jgi:hypothetical protein
VRRRLLPVIDRPAEQHREHQQIEERDRMNAGAGMLGGKEEAPYLPALRQ